MSTDGYCNYAFEFDHPKTNEKIKRRIYARSVRPTLRYVHKSLDIFDPFKLSADIEGSKFDLLGKPAEIDGYIPATPVVLTEDQEEAIRNYIRGLNTKKVVKLFGQNPLVSSQQKYTLFRGLSWKKAGGLAKFLEECEKNKIVGSFFSPSSWTSNICIAEYFASKGDTGVVLKHRFILDDVLVDTRLLENTYEREVIIKPGEYECSIYEVTRNGKWYKPDGTEISPIILE